MHELALRHRGVEMELTADLEAVLLSYRWPGNLRELVNVLERVVILARDTKLGIDLLPDEMRQPPAGAAGAADRRIAGHGRAPASGQRTRPPSDSGGRPPRRLASTHRPCIASASAMDCCDYARISAKPASRVT